MKNIDLNADMGESFGPWKMGNDGALLQVITSANVACGFHAGDPDVMQQTMQQQLARLVFTNLISSSMHTHEKSKKRN